MLARGADAPGVGQRLGELVRSCGSHASGPAAAAARTPPFRQTASVPCDLHAMEASAATPLRRPAHVRTAGEALFVDGLVVEDACAVRLAREREEAGDPPPGSCTDAIEIGARVLDREQTAAHADFVKAEFERPRGSSTARSSSAPARWPSAWTRRSTRRSGEEHGHVAKALERHFGDASSEAVQHKVKPSSARSP